MPEMTLRCRPCGVEKVADYDQDDPGHVMEASNEWRIDHGGCEYPSKASQAVAE